MTDNRHREMPIILADTSALRELAQAEHDNDSALPITARTASAQSLQTIMDTLSEDRTIILTRENLKELFPVVRGRVDFCRNDDGSIGIPLGLHPTQFNREWVQSLYRVFAGYAQEGRLRVYSSIDAMLEAGEIIVPQGGIVIVDTEQLDVTSEGIKRLRQMPPALQSARWNPVAAADFYRDHADACLLKVADALFAHAEKTGASQRFLLLNNDGQLTADIIDHAHEARQRVPCVSRVYELLWGMHKSGIGRTPMTETTAEAFADAVAYGMNYGPTIDLEQFSYYNEQISNWLRATAAIPEGPDRPTLGKHSAQAAQAPDSRVSAR